MKQGKRKHMGKRIVASILALLLAVTTLESVLPQTALKVYAATEKSDSNTALGVSNISNPSEQDSGTMYITEGSLTVIM